MSQPVQGLTSHFTYKANLKHTRYGWLRLTPAHSVHLNHRLTGTTEKRRSYSRSLLRHGNDSACLRRAWD